jgi:hypothetical protein
LSWLAPNLGVWYGSLLMRDEQYRAWLAKGRPNSFWLTGFFNPQGFLTSVQQEITRAHKAENWALDSVVIHSEVSDIDGPDHVRNAPKVSVCRQSPLSDRFCLIIIFNVRFISRRASSSTACLWTEPRGR